MEAVILTIVFLALAVFGVGVLWFSKDQRGRRRLKNLESSPIANATEGSLVKVRGTLALAGSTDLDAPLTGRRCVGYVVEVKERRQAGADANWVTLVMKEDAVAFVVEDATGRALVNTEGAHLVLVRDGHVRTGELSDCAERAQKFLVELGTPSENALWTRKSLRYEEGVLEPGEEVSVMGVGRWETVPAAMRRPGDGEDAKWLVLHSTSEQVLTISDDPSTL